MVRSEARDGSGGTRRCEPERDSGEYLADEERDGIALCLSGGGYRAALFHLGALRRLNELGALSRVKTISGVSGGSILAAHLAAKAAQPWPSTGPLPDFDRRVAEPFREFTKHNIRTLWFFKRLLPWNWPRSDIAVRSLERRYRRDINGSQLSELPGPDQAPRFVFSATDMAFGINWESDGGRVGSYIPGYVSPPPEDWSVARAVAASSCFPPVFEPMAVNIEPGRFHDGQDPAPWEDRCGLISSMRLTDGGVYDNMALEPVWKRHEVVLVSDGGATFDSAVDGGVLRSLNRLGRYTGIQGRQASAVRKRWLMSNFKLKELRGAYWGIGSDVKNYDKNLLGYSTDLVDRVISEVRTDLDYFTDAEAEVLQNHGYLLADAAMHCHGQDWADNDAPARSVPFPEWSPNQPDDKVREALKKSSRRRIVGRWRLLDGPCVGHRR